jgi:hypothetical protein
MLSRGISGTNVTRFGGIPVGLHSANFTNQICRTPIDLMVPHTGICAACVPAFRRDPFRGQPESIPRSSMSYGLICKASVQFARAGEAMSQNKSQQLRSSSLPKGWDAGPAASASIYVSETASRFVRIPFGFQPRKNDVQLGFQPRKNDFQPSISADLYRE